MGDKGGACDDEDCNGGVVVVQHVGQWWVLEVVLCAEKRKWLR